MHLLTRSWSYNSINRSSHWRFSVQKSVFRNFTTFTGKHLCQSLFFNEVAGLKPSEFCEISKNTFLQDTSGRLLLNISEKRQ